MDAHMFRVLYGDYVRDEALCHIGMRVRMRVENNVVGVLVWVRREIGDHVIDEIEGPAMTHHVLHKFSTGVLCNTCGGSGDTGTGHKWGCATVRFDLTLVDHPDLVDFDDWLDQWYEWWTYG